MVDKRCCVHELRGKQKVYLHASRVLAAINIVLMSLKDAVSAAEINSANVNKAAAETKRAISFQLCPARARFHLPLGPLSRSDASRQNKSKAPEQGQGWAQVRSCDNGY